MEHITEAFENYKESLEENIKDCKFILNQLPNFFNLDPMGQEEFFNTVRDMHFNVEHLLKEIIMNDINGISLGQGNNQNSINSGNNEEGEEGEYCGHCGCSL